MCRCRAREGQTRFAVSPSALRFRIGAPRAAFLFGACMLARCGLVLFSSLGCSLTQERILQRPGPLSARLDRTTSLFHFKKKRDRLIHGGLQSS
jgi:hypothetical protein